jgi:sugar phosphate permease
VKATPSQISPSGARSALRWRMALLVSAAIVLSYLDRQTLPWTLSHIKEQYPFSDQVKATFDSAFLVAYGLMYLGRRLAAGPARHAARIFADHDFLVAGVASQGLAANYGMPPVFGLAFAWSC